MLQAGELPAFRKYFVDRGLYVRHAIASIPSVTTANLTSLSCGRFPGHTGILGVNWFDRGPLVWRDYNTIAQKDLLDTDYTTPNWYASFADRLTFSIFFQPHREATKFFEDWASAGPPFFFGWYEYVDRLTLWRLDEAMAIARRRRQFPAMTTCYLLTTDFRAYQQGVGSEDYRQAIRHCDYQIGRVLGDLERCGLLEHITLALVSDHSMAPVHSHFDIPQFLADRGLDLSRQRLWENVPFEERLREYGKRAAVVYGSGNRYQAICLRKPIRADTAAAGYRDWSVRPDEQDLRHYPTAGGPVDLIDLLARQSPVDAVAYAAGPNRVRVTRDCGQIEFAQEAGPGGDITARLTRGADPLGWSGKVPAHALQGKPLPPRQWQELTAATNYPDLPEQILAYFRSRRAGDLAVFAAPDWDFNHTHVAGHGGLRPGDMCTVMLLAGPGVPHQRLEYARTVDLMPTLLRLQGRPLPGDLDGRPLVPSR
jgi:arylsulfatase A-like enzyme